MKDFTKSKISKKLKSLRLDFNEEKIIIDSFKDQLKKGYVLNRSQMMQIKCFENSINLFSGLLEIIEIFNDDTK